MIEPIVDVSKWQGDINKQKMLAAKPLGIIIRAGSINHTTGECYEDYQFRNNARKFNGEIPCGYYWYFRPEHSATIQASYFSNLLKEVQVDLDPWADTESNDGHVSMGTFQTNLNTFLFVTDSMLDVDSVIYTRGSFWNPHVGNPAWAKERRLCIAMYSDTAQHPWNGFPSYYRPAPWNDFLLWQYSADGNGRGAEFGAESSAIDINRYNGTLAQFHKDANWNQSAPATRLCVVLGLLKRIVDKFAANCDAARSITPEDE